MSQVKYVYFFVATLFLINAISLLIFIVSPGSGTVRGYFLNEDSLIETLSAGLFFGAFLLAFMLLAACNEKNQFHCRWLILLLVFGTIGFLDELSFGERLFDLEMPELAGVKIDALHDFFNLTLTLIFKLISHDQIFALLLILIGFVLSILGILKYGKRIWYASIKDGSFQVSLIMLMFIAFIFSALLLDAELLPFWGSRALEEMFELNAAMALFTSCLVVYKLGINKIPYNRQL